MLLFTCIVAFPALAQIRDRDPLTEAEVDQMREAADYPNKRLELMVRFAKERIATIDQLRADPSGAATRPRQIHDLLQDFITLLDETDDNIDMYASHKSDLRKGLKLLIEANSEWLRRDQSDLDGSFSLINVIPGDYVLVAIDDGWDLNWSQPGIMAHYLEQGQKVSVSAGLIQLKEAAAVQPK